MIVNRLVTRGFGPDRGLPGRAGPVTQGFGGPPSFVLVAIRRGIRVGGGATRRRLQDLQPVIVWAKLIEINGLSPQRAIEGSVRVMLPRQEGFTSVMVEHLKTRARKAWDDVRITVRRLK